jgi:MinD superfamily P-loop ATPase
MPFTTVRQLKKWANLQPGQVIIRDASPGISCPMVKNVRKSDYLILVTEPIPFGLHDLRLAVRVADEWGITGGLIINRENSSHLPLDKFCDEHRLPILLQLPFEHEFTEGITQGKYLVEIRPMYQRLFWAFFSLIIARHQGGGS